MSRASAPATHRRFDWRRVAITMIGLIGTWFAFSLAVAGVMRNRAPNVALRFVPGEPIALTMAANQLSQASPTKPPERVRILALAALKGQALNPYALRILGYFYGSRGRDDLSMRYIRLAEGQTRRDAAAQLLLIEDAVRSGNVNRVLRHYDIVFRVEPKTYVLLFPVLLSALNEKDIRAALIPYVRQNADWMPMFLNHAIANSQNLPALVDLIVSARGVGTSAEAGDLFRSLVRRLVAERRFDLLQRLYSAMPGADQSRLTNIAFDQADIAGTFGAIGWQIRSNGDAGSSFTNGRGSPIALSVYANPSAADVVATKLLILRPGTYDLSATVDMNPKDAREGLQWQMRCVEPAAETPLWTLQGASIRNARFTVPQYCQAQELSIRIDALSSPDELDATITRPSLRPIPN